MTISAVEKPLSIARQHLLVARTLRSDERRAVERGATRGEFVRLRPGVYLPTGMWTVLDSRERAICRIAALQATASGAVLFSHWSAAALLGLPVPHREAETVHRVVAEGSAWTQSAVALHRLATPDDDVVEVDGLLVTSLARTAVDLAAAHGFETGVMVADAALRILGGEAEGARESLSESWRRVPGRRGGERVAAAVEFADPLSESAAESRSRVTMHRLGLPRPVLQQRFFDEEGEVAWVDFWFPEQQVVGECDGTQKYVGAATSSGDPVAAVLAEKRREDRLRALVRGLARWGWTEAVDGSRLAPRLARAGVMPTERRARGRATKARN